MVTVRVNLLYESKLVFVRLWMHLKFQSNLLCLVVDCFYSGTSNIDSVEKMKNLSNSRISEIRLCLQTTHCLRQNWVTVQHPTISQLLDSYPKFTTLPELVCFLPSFSFRA